LRTVRTLLLVGFEADKADPNFAGFLRWSRTVFAGSEYRHFRLVSASEVEKARLRHPADDRIFVLEYGSTASDLIAFLRSLLSGRKDPPRAEAAPRLREGPALPPPPYCVGRKREVRALASALLADDARPVRVHGLPGVGKSTVAVSALHDPAVSAFFGERRFFVRCDAAGGAAGLVGLLARALGLEVATAVGLALRAALERAPAVMVLDNLEGPWDQDPDGVASLLADLCSLTGVRLVATIRGLDAPAGVLWRDPPLRIDPLQLEPAHELNASDAATAIRAHATFDAAGTHDIVVRLSYSDAGAVERIVPLVVLAARNPYVAGPPISDTRLFVGRATLIEQLARELANHSVLLHGPWRIGKSSVLRQLATAPPRGFEPILLDVQRYADDVDRFLPGLAEVLGAAPGSRPTGDDLVRLAKSRLAARPGTHHVLLLVDEAGILFASPRVLTLLRGLRTPDSPIAMVLSSSQLDLDRAVLETAGSPQVNDLVSLPMSRLSETAAEDLVRLPLRSSPYDWSDEAVRLVLEPCRGRPYLIQLLCHAAFDHAVEARRRTVEAEDVDASQTVLWDVLVPQFGDLARRLAPSSRRALRKGLALDRLSADARLLGAFGLLIDAEGRPDPLFVRWLSAQEEEP